jgi:hypothetical protein
MFFDDLTRLNIAGVKYNTNKASTWLHPSGAACKGGDLLKKYQFFLDRFLSLVPAGQQISILELGAGPDDNIGASIRAWKEYFPAGTNIHVADIKESAMNLSQEGFLVHVGDLGSQAFLDGLSTIDYDFVIDDASHFWLHQIMSFRSLFPRVKPGGLFIMEDLCTSTDASVRDSYSLNLDMKDALDFFAALSRCVVGESWLAYPSPSIQELYNLSESDYQLASSIEGIFWMGNSCVCIKK